MSLARLSFDDANMYFMLKGMKYSVTLSVLSIRLMRAPLKHKENYRLSPAGFTIFWPKLDLELPVKGIMQMAQRVY